MIAFLLCMIVCGLNAWADNDKPIQLNGYIVESIAHQPLIGAKVALLDSAFNVIDSTTAKIQGTLITGTPSAPFKLNMPRRAGTYYISADYDGYNHLLKELNVSRVGGRELTRDLGNLEMVRAPKQLGEITVVATKVKFYNKGDTIVYNADAFDLPEGSMLDALVSQMPGVEIKEGGQIFVNGRYVESLILDGKEFFQGNSSVMLENLGSYMIKDVAVYEKLGQNSKFMGRDMGDKQYVMDVRLKKDYHQGWIANVEAGGGTRSRYMGRLFGMRYTDFTRVGIFANVNNLNDNQKPGQSGSFNPSKMPVGSVERQQAGITYNIYTRDDSWYSQGDITWEHTVNNIVRNTTATNFLPGGDNYRYGFSDGRLASHNIRFFSSSYRNWEKLMLSFTPLVTYNSYNDRQNSIEATFNSEQQEVTRALLESLYSGSDTGSAGDKVNRVVTHSLGKGHDFNGTINLSPYYKIPYTDDQLQGSVKFEYGESRKRAFDYYKINTGDNTVATTDRGLWSDTKPNRNYKLSANVAYRWLLPGLEIAPNYTFSHDRRDKDMLTYVQERLADQGIYGLTSSETAEFSVNDSYWSNLTGNTHGFSGWVDYTCTGYFQFYFNGGVDLRNEHLTYNRFNRPFYTRRSSAIPSIREARVNFGLSKYNSMWITYKLNGIAPQLEWLLPITDSTDPMNIYTGAESLKNQLNHNFEIRWWLRSPKINHSLYLTYQKISNALVRGYTYDTATGVRTIRSYNTSGNWTEGIKSVLALSFGPKKAMTLSNTVSLTYGHVTDMIGTDVDVPQQSLIRNTFFSENLSLTWKIGRQSIGLKGDFIWRHTTGEREGFNKIVSNTMNLGLSGVFQLPAGFNLSTDLTFYSRGGYDDPGLDSRDIVWNARLAKAFGKGRWTVMLDGFDLLHQLSNVTYAINAQGRTVTYTNTLPRYVLLHVIYRIDIKPKKH